MYQEIDSPDENESESTTQTPKRVLIGLAFLLGLCLLITAILIFSRGNHTTGPDEAALEREQAAYFGAISHSEPAMRRARLMDFINSHPDSARKNPAKALLSVIDIRESADWAALSHTTFDPDKTAADKQFKLEDYERKWNPGLLGGRADEIARLRETLSSDPEVFPDRSLPVVPGAYPEGENAGEMVGGVETPRRAYIPPAVTVIPAPPEPALIDPSIIVPAKIRRNRTPRYPARALQRDVEATVVLKLLINRRGRVETTELVSVDASRYQREFIRAAERAALRTRYIPKTINGTPTDTQLEKRYVFRIDP